MEKCVCVLIEAGSDIDRNNNLGVTPLCGTAIFANEEYVELLINTGADVNLAKQSSLIFALNKISTLDSLLIREGNLPVYRQSFLVFYKKFQFERKRG